MDWKWIGSGLEVDWKWIGSGLEVDWKWIESGLEVDWFFYTKVFYTKLHRGSWSKIGVGGWPGGLRRQCDNMMYNK